ncbi:MAG: porin, partial [Roseovarius sp.]|nr:porin [Roseovarius sp.]
KTLTTVPGTPAVEAVEAVEEQLGPLPLSLSEKTLTIARIDSGDANAEIDAEINPALMIKFKALEKRPNLNLYGDNDDRGHDSRFWHGTIANLIDELQEAVSADNPQIVHAYITDVIDAPDPDAEGDDDPKNWEEAVQKAFADLGDVASGEIINAGRIEHLKDMTIEFVANDEVGDGEEAETVVVAKPFEDPEGAITVAAVEGVEAVAAVPESVNTAIAKYDGSGMHSNTEVHFMPSITLDSGLTFGATIEFEGDSEKVDQSYISVGSESLGTLKIGKHGKTGLGVHAPSVGIGINSGDHVNFIAVKPEGGAMSGTNSSIIGTADRVSYTTPKNALAGFSFGISYAPGGDNERNVTAELDNGDVDVAVSGNGRRSGFLTKKKTGMSDNVDIAFKFEQPFGDANFALGMRYGTAKEEGATKNPRNFGIGASVGFGGFTFGGSYADVERATLAKSSSGWNLGASYAMGAWTFGIETYQGEADDGDEHSVSKIAASRKLGPGVDWDLYAITASSKNTISTSVREEASGNAFGTAIKLTF